MTPSQARRYLLSWFTWLISGAAMLFTFAISRTPLFMIFAATGFVAVWSLERIGSRLATEEDRERGIIAEQIRVSRGFDEVVKKPRFEEAVRLLNLRRGRWLALRLVANAVVAISAVTAGISELVRG